MENVDGVELEIYMFQNLSFFLSDQHIRNPKSLSLASDQLFTIVNMAKDSERCRKNFLECGVRQANSYVKHYRFVTT